MKQRIETKIHYTKPKYTDGEQSREMVRECMMLSYYSHVEFGVRRHLQNWQKNGKASKAGA
jgi:hypothetical protein